MFSGCILIRKSFYPLSRLLGVAFELSDFYNKQQIKLYCLFFIIYLFAFSFSLILSWYCQLFPRSWEENFKILFLAHQGLCCLAQNKFQIHTPSQKNIIPELSEYALCPKSR